MTTPSTASPEEWREKLEACEKTRDEYLEGWKRANADYANLQKESRARAEALATHREAEILLDLIDALDAFDQALRIRDDEGIRHLKKKLEDILVEHHTTRIDIAPGAMFDPEYHEALTGEGEKIAEVLQHGYLHYEKVLRPVRVRLDEK